MAIVQPTRRQVLQGIAAGAAGLALAGTATRLPVASASVARPTGSGTVRYEDLYRPGKTLQRVIQDVPAGKILTFPEGEFTFRDFTSPVGYHEGIRITPNCRGIAGSGRNTVFKMVPYSSSQAKLVPPQTKRGASNPLSLMRISKVDNAVLMNFSLIGTPQGHLYGGLTVTAANNVLLDGLYLRGASPGVANTPPGETFGINFTKLTNPTFRNSEIDGRDASGGRICAAPMGWNDSRDITIENVYAHHSRAGTCTFYQCINVTTTDLRSEYNGSGDGSLRGSGINHESVSGRIRHIRPTLIIDRARGNTGSHFNLQNGTTDVTDVVLSDVVHDAGPGAAGCFSYMNGDTYRDPQGRIQKQRTLPKITKNGVTLTAVDAKKGTSGARADRNYIWYH